MLLQQSTSYTPPKKSLYEPQAKYDLMKFFLSLLVVAIHTSLYPTVLYPWLRIAVPLFFITSSYFLFSKLKNTSAEKQKDILKKFVIRNLCLYFCWFIILLPLVAFVQRNLYFSKGILDGILTLLKNIFFGSTFLGSWFIMATVIGVLIVYWLSKLLRHKCIVFFISLLAFCFITLASSYKFALANTFLLTAIEKYIAIFGELVCSFPTAVFWVFIGKLFAEQKINIKSTFLLIFLILCNLIALFAEWSFVKHMDGSYRNDSYFMLAPLCTLLFIGIQKIKPSFWQNSIFFRRASTIIYVVHGTLVPIISLLLSKFFHTNSNLLLFLTTFLCCMFVYIIIEFLIKKCTYPRINKLLKMLY